LLNFVKLNTHIYRLDAAKLGIKKMAGVLCLLQPDGNYQHPNNWQKAHFPLEALRNSVTGIWQTSCFRTGH